MKSQKVAWKETEPSNRKEQQIRMRRGPKSLISGKLRFCFKAGFAIVTCFLPAGLTEMSAADGTEFAKYAMKLRQNAWLKISPKIIMAPVLTTGGSFGSNDLARSGMIGPGGWKLNIMTTVFWVGEQATINNPVPNDKSAWDGGWSSSYGGYDNPNPGSRVNFIPINFLPRQNPFYVALPYNDVDEHRTKAEAATVIPWFRRAFVRDGQTVCKGRWVAIRRGKKVCYAQWEDVGPFTTDDWEYVFSNKAPKPNRNQNAGIDVSPAVRDYLGIGGLDSCDWKFVDFQQVSAGPWTKYGDNNTFVRMRRQIGPVYASDPTPRRPVGISSAN